VTPDELLAICENTTAEDWTYWVYVPFARPGVISVSPAAAKRGAAAAHRARAVLRADVSIGLAWGVVECREAQRREPTVLLPDPSRCHWVDLLHHGHVVERYLAVAAEGEGAMLPAPTLERREDTEDVTLWVCRRKFAIVRLANEIDPECSGFDECFARSGIEVR
jgi:hypothetical protein